MTFMRASGVRRGEGENGVTDSPAAVGHLVDAGPPQATPAIGRSSVARPITSVDAWFADPFPMALAEVVVRLGAHRLAPS
jgi:hypothetical protein